MTSRLARAPRILTTVALAWLASIAVLASDTGVDLIGFFLVVYGGLALAVAWAARVAMFLLARKHADSPPPVSRTWWLLVPACLILVVAIVLVDGPRYNPLFQLRFHLSESALTAAADDLLRQQESTHMKGRRIGLFRATRIDVRKGQVRLITSGCGVVDACGLVYAPGRAPETWMEDRFTHLRGSWWHVYEGF